MSIGLSVMIPTYNRKEDLLKTLKSLERQTVNNFYVVISDNASEYSVEKEIMPMLTKEFAEKVMFYKNKYNIGGSHNVLKLFSLCETKWAWFLGDDDSIKDNSVEIVLKWINRYSHVGGFWFSLVKKDAEYVVLKNLQEYVNLEEELAFSGDAIFVSNKVYNTEIIKNYMYQVHKHVYTAIPQCILIFEMLKRGVDYVVVFEDKIVEHSGFKEGFTWNVSTVMLCMRTLMDYDSGLSWNYHKRLVKCSMLNTEIFIKSCIMQKELEWQNKKYYKKTLYYDYYQYVLSWQKKLFVRLWIAIAGTKTGCRLMQKIYFYMKRKRGR